jgi:hypothetical protein
MYNTGGGGRCWEVLEGEFCMRKRTYVQIIINFTTITAAIFSRTRPDSHFSRLSV